MAANASYRRRMDLRSIFVRSTRRAPARAAMMAAAMTAATLGGCALQLEDVTQSMQEALMPALEWVGDAHMRYEGRFVDGDLVMSDRDLDVYGQTYPGNAAATVELQWLAAGAHRSAVMALDMVGAGQHGNNDQWRASIPAADLVDGRPLAWWIRATDAAGNVHWDSRGGENYVITPRSPILLDSTGCWHMAGRGDVVRDGGVFRAVPGDGLGLLWCALPLPADYELAVEWRMTRPDDNGGVVLGFRDPESFGYENPAWVGVHDGLEVQIDELGRPDAAPWHMTGAIYDERSQDFARVVPRPAGQWNAYVIRVEAQRYSVSLNGQALTALDWRGDAARPERAQPVGARFFGLQAHTGHVEYRNITLRPLGTSSRR
jgi:hypothetical protein